jgi:hypothetical protein
MGFLLPQLFAGGVMRTLVTAARRQSAVDAWRALQKLFTIHPDRYWRTHLHFKATSGPAGVAIGRTRIIEIAINVVAPALLLAARLFTDADLEEKTRALVERIPPPLSNRLVRTVRGCLGPGVPVSSALEHQGVLELYGRRCQPDQCSSCPIGAAMMHLVPGSETIPV